jgi:uncharacterized membrane protein YphA (DoxX/SURF4 family)
MPLRYGLLAMVMAPSLVVTGAGRWSIDRSLASA